MPMALEEVTIEAMQLPPRERLALAELLLGSADAAADPDAKTAWDFEIRNRIRAIDKGRLTGVAYEDVMRAAERLGGAARYNLPNFFVADLLNAKMQKQFPDLLGALSQ